MTLLELRDFSVTYGSGSGRFTAVDAVNLEIGEGEIVGLVGESGSGKSTLAKAIVALAPVTGGSVTFRSVDVSRTRDRTNRSFRRSVQMVFQDPYSSLNPRMTLGQLIDEPLVVHRMGNRAHRQKEVRRLLQAVALPVAWESKYPVQLSGGQRQRVALARALAVRPELIIADEITAALDVSIQAEILNLLKDLQREHGTAMLFISHNLGVVRFLAKTTAVMYLGQVVETGDTDAVFGSPRHPYTRSLLDAIPRMNQDHPEQVTLLGEPPDPHNPPSGCRFHPRCPIGPAVRADRQSCMSDEPRLLPLEGGLVACPFAGTESSEAIVPAAAGASIR